MLVGVRDVGLDFVDIRTKDLLKLSLVLGYLGSGEHGQPEKSGGGGEESHLCSWLTPGG